MSSMRINARLDTFHHAPPHPFRDGGAVADSLPGIHPAMVKCLFVVNRSCIHKGFTCPHRYKSRRFKSGEHGGQAVANPSTCTSVTTGVTENISLCCQWYTFQ
jgi:hypothetical protein